MDCHRYEQTFNDPNHVHKGPLSKTSTTAYGPRWVAGMSLAIIF